MRHISSSAFPVRESPIKGGFGFANYLIGRLGEKV